jgi:hypothetical protein
MQKIQPKYVSMIETASWKVRPGREEFQGLLKLVSPKIRSQRELSRTLSGAHGKPNSLVSQDPILPFQGYVRLLYVADLYPLEYFTNHSEIVSNKSGHVPIEQIAYAITYYSKKYRTSL